jgi:DNA helicase-2/ATP-dependent DNA helicase PcrA
MDKAFKTAYARLNDAQKEAVDYIDGPLLVIAGPGTGKTELLSLRVANILLSTDTDPSSIICLTFTNFAASNMQQRLFNLIGADAYRVNIKTFHSYAAEIMQEFPDYFWNGASLSIVPDAVKTDIITSILDDLPLNNPLSSKFAGKYTALYDIQQALTLSKEAGLSPDKLRAMLDSNDEYINAVESKLVTLLSERLNIKKLDKLKSEIDNLPDQNIEEAIMPLVSLSLKIKESLDRAIEQDEASGKLKNVSKWKSQWIQTVSSKSGLYNERKRNEWWRNLAYIYEKYRDELHTRGFYDYSDMLIEVITQLDSHPDLLSLVQEKYLYVLIDEFQDTNAAQFRLANLSSNHYLDEGMPNLMAVGDDDQTIYAFNGAEINNMLTFIRSYPKTKVVALVDNYRSTQSVLDKSENIISLSSSRLIDRLDHIDKNLKSKSNATKGTLERRIYPTREHQFSELAKRIKKSWEENPTKTIAILARSHDSLVNFSSYLLNLKVNISYEKQNDILENELIKQLVLLARIISDINIGNEKPLNYHIATLLKYPAWQVSPKELWQLSIESYKTRNNWLNILLESKDEKLKDYANWFLLLAKQSELEPLQVMMEELIGLKASEHMTSPLRDYYLSNSKRDSFYLETISALGLLKDIAKQYKEGSKNKPKISDLVSLIDTTLNSNQTITDQSWFITSDKSVQLMTVHKSKGLEFDSVYLIDATDKNWKPRTKLLRSPSNLPLQPYGEDLDDYIRLAYVAATRARSNFTVSSYKYSLEGDSVLSSPLFSSLETIDQEEDFKEPKNNIEVIESGLVSTELKTDNIKSLLGPILSNFKLSATSLNQYLDIANNGPDVFFERNIFRMPQRTTPEMAFGTAIHASLETAQHEAKNNVLSINKVIDSFNSSLSKQGLSLSDESRYKEKGKTVLENLLIKQKYPIQKNGEAEVDISTIKLPGGAVISGKLDNIVINKDEVLITDYKTGNPLGSFTSKAKDKAIKSWQHKNQLLFYALLVKSSPRFKAIKSIKTQIVYVEAESSRELVLTYEPTSEEIETLEKLISIVYKNVMALKQIDLAKYAKSIDGIKSFESDLLLEKV